MDQRFLRLSYAVLLSVIIAGTVAATPSTADARDGHRGRDSDRSWQSGGRDREYRSQPSRSSSQPQYRSSGSSVRTYQRPQSSKSQPVRQTVRRAVHTVRDIGGGGGVNVSALVPAQKSAAAADTISGPATPVPTPTLLAADRNGRPPPGPYTRVLAATPEAQSAYKIGGLSNQTTSGLYLMATGLAVVGIALLAAGAGRRVQLDSLSNPRRRQS